jgi:hypothetical protein
MGEFSAAGGSGMDEGRAGDVFDDLRRDDDHPVDG